MQRPVKKMRHRVMPLDGGASSRVDLQRHLAALPGNPIALDDVQKSVAHFLCVNDLPFPAIKRERAGIAQLATHLGIKRGTIQNDRRPFFILHHLKHLRRGRSLFEPNELRAGIRRKAADTDDLLLLGRAGTLPLLGHQFFKANIVHLQPGLASHQLRQVQWKAVSVVKFEGKLAGKLLPFSQLIRLFLEQVDAAVEGLVEGLLLGTDGVRDEVAPLPDLRENIAHRLHQHIHELVKKRFLKTESTPVAHRPTQDASQHVVAVGVARDDAVRDGKTQRPNVIPDHAKRHVDFLLLRRFIARQSRGVTLAALFLELGKNRAEHIGVVVRDSLAKIGKAAGRLHDGRDALETHPGVDVLGRKRRKRAVDVRVVLDENKVPNLDALRTVGVDQPPFRIACLGEVHVQFAAGATRAGVAHHPEIVLLVAVDDVNIRVEPGLLENGLPEIVRLLIQFARVALARLVHRGVKALLRELPNPGDQFPCPLDGFLLEIISKRPVAEHLKEGVVIGVHPHILEVVVFAPGADAFLRVGGAARRIRAGLFTEKNRHELVHPCVGEKQVWRVRHQARGRHNRVLPGLKKIEKRLSNLRTGHYRRRKMAAGRKTANVHGCKPNHR